MPLVTELQKSLQQRFSGVFVNVGMQEPPKVLPGSQEIVTPFSDKVYLVAALLDPTFAMMWVENDVLIETDKKVVLKRSLKGSESNLCILLT